MYSKIVPVERADDVTPLEGYEIAAISNAGLLPGLVRISFLKKELVSESIS